jgi:hypothetical protein
VVLLERRDFRAARSKTEPADFALYTLELKLTARWARTDLARRVGLVERALVRAGCCA